MEQLEEEFPNKIGLLELVALGIASLTGAGIYSLISPTVELAGPAALISLFIGSVFAILIAGVYSELVSVYPKNGGGFVFIEKAYGEKGLYLGWLIWLANMSYAALVCYTAALFIVNLFQINSLFSIPLGIIFVLLMAGTNTFGSKFLSRIQIPLTVALVVSLIVGSLYLFTKPSGHFSWDLNYFIPFGILPIISAAAILFNIFIGFEDVGAIAEEIKHPEKNLPRAFIIMIIVATIIYTMVMASILFSMELSEIITSDVAFLEAVEDNEVMFLVVYLGAIFSLLATAGVALMAASRNVYALSKRDFMDRRYSKINEKSGAPVKAVFLSAIITSLILTSGQIEFYASVSVVSYMIKMVFMCLTIFKFRKTEEYTKDSFKIPLHPFSTILVMLISVLFIISIEISSLIVAIFWLLLGLILYLFFSSKRRVYGTIFLVTAFFFAISSILVGVIIISIGFIYYLLSISDRSSIKLTLAGIKCIFIILTIIFIWLITNTGQGGANKISIALFFDGFLLNLLIFICIIASITVVLEIVPIKEWIYFLYKKSAKKEVAIKIGDGQIIDLSQSHQKLLYYSNDILGYLQIISSVFILLIVSLIMSETIIIEEIALGNIIFSQEASTYLFTVILIIFGILVGLSGALTIYFNRESKIMGI